MRFTTRFAAAAAACLALTAAAPASAEPVEHSTFHFEFDSTADCGDGLVLEFHDVVDGRVIAIRHGDGLIYATQHWTLTAVATIPGTALTLTVVNKGLVGHDVRISNNGDGTLTVRAISPARVVVLGPDGRPESHFSGLTTVEQLWDDAGTPDVQDDDVLLEEQITSHGHSVDDGACDVARRYAP
jgi:hypothetical protein